MDSGIIGGPNKFLDSKQMVIEKIFLANIP